jgi:hypothetical protein
MVLLKPSVHTLLEKRLSESKTSCWGKKNLYLECQQNERMAGKDRRPATWEKPILNQC